MNWFAQRLRFIEAAGALVGTESDPTPRTSSGRAPTVLALHGFGATPREMDPVGDVSESLGLGFRAPLLPGHGTTFDDFARTRYADWLGAARHELSQAARSGPVVVVGLSMGSVLAMQLAVETPSLVHGLVLMANAIRLHWPYPSLALELVDWLRLPNFKIPKFSGPDIADPGGRLRHLNYSASSALGAASLQKAARRLSNRLGKIACPTLIIHGRLDRVAPVRNAALVAQRVGTLDKQLVVLQCSHHIITKDLETARVQSALRGFLVRVGSSLPVT